jgi:GNAT superfamily N-acetyltransferase
MDTILERRRGSLLISTDPSRLDLDAICDFLARSYWAQDRPRESTEASLSSSLVFGVYDGKRQVGLARIVTDYATFAWLCDVFVDEAYRGQGIGKWLMATILDHPRLAGIRRILLATRDAHGLYRQFGFVDLNAPERWMERLVPYPESRARTRA